MENEIKKTIEVLRAGGTILYPTDTIWGLGCDATRQDAVEKICLIKNRPDSKSFIILVSDERMLQKYVYDVPAIARDLIGQSASPLTIIYDTGINLAPAVLGENGSVAVRIPADEFCGRLIHQFGRPVVSTSANRSGEPAPASFRDIHPDIVRSVDHVVNWRQAEQKQARPSSIIKLGANGEIKIIRK
ncbi:MAG: L-threonylcarbamoyladenylate synthase [Bacteroidota bacterium]